MISFAIAFLVGILCIFLGSSMMDGNISSIQAYHRRRVSESDSVPFGKRVGLGIILIGFGVAVFSILAAATLFTGKRSFLLAGTAVLTVFLASGLSLIVHALRKYNKGIF